MLVTKIVIHLPSDGSKLFTLLPFLYLLRSEIKEGEVHISLLGGEELKSYVAYMPMVSSFHALPEKKLTPWEAHRFAFKIKTLFNIDYYFDFEGTFVSSLLGICFRAQKRIGIGKQISKLCLHRSLAPEEFRLDRDYLTLVTELFPSCVLPPSLYLERQRPPLSVAPGPVSRVLFVTTGIYKEDLFLSEKILLLSDSTLPGETAKFDFQDPQFQFVELAKAMIFTEYLLTDSVLLAQLASYLGIKVLAISDKRIEPLTQFKHPITWVYPTTKPAMMAECLEEKNEFLRDDALGKFIQKFLA